MAGLWRSGDDLEITGRPVGVAVSVGVPVVGSVAGPGMSEGEGWHGSGYGHGPWTMG